MAKFYTLGCYTAKGLGLAKTIALEAYDFAKATTKVKDVL